MRATASLTRAHPATRRSTTALVRVKGRTLYAATASGQATRPKDEEEAQVMSSPFRTFTGIGEYEFVPGVHIKAVGGEQVLMCLVRYEPGKEVPRHSHEHTEQVMYILDGEVTMTIEDETRTLVAGDTVVVNRGLEHELHSEPGVTFMEALAPVPLDHVPDKSRDLVLGPDAGATHVER
jgi:quercetin dioxygenase-like cupin family protein